MVKEEQYEGKTIYACSICGFGYETTELAQQCENYCKEHSSCSLEITKNAVRT